MSLFTGARVRGEEVKERDGKDKDTVLQCAQILPQWRPPFQTGGGIT